MVKSLAVKILPPKVIVLLPLFTPVPPYVPAIACVKFAVPSKELPYIVLAVSSFVVVLALPAKLPVTLPTTLPVTLPVNDAVIVPALKLPLPSLLTNVLTVLLVVAEATVVLIVAIVEEFTPPTLFTVGKSAVPPRSLANLMIPLAVVVASVAAFDI